MINVENGKVEIKGEMPNILTDLTLAIKAIRLSITEDRDAENAKEMIDKCVELAFMDDDEIHEAVQATMANVIKDLLSDDEFLDGFREFLKERIKE